MNHLYEPIVEIKHNLQSHEAKKESNQATTQIVSQGKLADQNPSIIYYIFHKESWNNYNALFSQESPAICLLSHTDPEKIGPTFANSQPVFNLPCSWNSWWMKSLLFRNFSLPQLHRVSWASCGVLTASGQPANITTDS